MRSLELYKYNPSQASPQELEATFVGRECMVDEILSKLRQQIQVKSNQNYLIVGQRGIGKTNLLLILQYRIQADKGLSKAYLPLSFAEEEYSIITLRDFFVRILEVLQQTRPEEQTLAALETISHEADDKAAVEKAIEFLKTFCQDNETKLLLFVDNLDLIFGDQIRQKSAVSRFRDVLMNYNFLLIIGAAPTYFKEIMGYDQPLYNFFKIYSLDEFDLELMEKLLCKRAHHDGNTELVERLKTYRPKLKALRHLTGGNPRLVLMLYQLLAYAELPEVKAALNALLDDLTPYFKHKLESIKSPQQRKIVDSLARLDKAATPTELAKATRLPVNQVSSLIKRLQDDGYVRPAPQQRRKATFYILSERLFRIWHQMRYMPANRRRMPFLVDFISLWYSSEELKKEFSRLEEQFEESVRAGRALVALGTVEHIGYLGEAAPSAQLKTEILDITILHYMDLGQWDEAQVELENELQRNLKANKPEQVAKYYYGLGLVHGVKARQTQDESLFQKAFEEYQQAIRIEPDGYLAWYNWGSLLGELAQLKGDEVLYRKAFEKYQQAVTIKPNLHEAWYNWGWCLGDLARLKDDQELYTAAFEKYRQAVTIKPDLYEAWYNWGNDLGDLARLKGDGALYREVFEKYQQAVTIKPDMHGAWYNWGVALSQLAILKNDEELLKQGANMFQKAIEIKPDKHEAIDGLGLIYANQNRLEPAAESFEKAWNIALENREVELAKYYAGNLLDALLDLTAEHINQRNVGQATRLFHRALELKSHVDERNWQGRLVVFFRSAVSKEKVELFFELYETLKQELMEQEVELLKPMAIACEYWQKGEDTELLDRLNPEVREVVEDIIKRSQKRTQEE